MGYSSVLNNYNQIYNGSYGRQKSTNQSTAQGNPMYSSGLREAEKKTSIQLKTTIFMLKTKILIIVVAFIAHSVTGLNVIHSLFRRTGLHPEAIRTM